MPIEYTNRDGVGLIELNFPERRNALGPSDCHVLGDVIEAAAVEAKTALVLTGRGAFCAGGHLKAFAEESRNKSEGEIYEIVYSSVQRVIRLLSQCPVPTIAAIDGAAIGLGMDLALACDMRFVGPDGWIRQGWATAGLIAGGGGVALLKRINPSILWKEVAEQSKLDGKACERLGLGEAALVSAMQAAQTRCDQLRDIPVEVLRAYVDLSRSDWPSKERFEAAARYQAHFIHSSEFQRRAEAILSAGSTAS
jgi:enoyl-CoA hydratase/carnithine racemase